MKKISMIVLIGICFSFLAQAQSLKITSPNGGESWPKDSVQAITWSASAIPASAKVRLTLFQGMHKVGVIATGQDAGAAGSHYDWTVGQYIGGGVEPGVGYKIFIDAGAVAEDFSDAAFSIGSPAQVVIIGKKHPELPPLLLKFPRLEVSHIDLAPNLDGFGITFSYKNAGNGALPKASEVPVKPNYRVLIDGRETAKGFLFIPAFAAPPGWEQTGYFGGWIKLPSLAVLAHESRPGNSSMYYEFATLYKWFIGDKITVHINENKVMGMESHTLSLDLKWLALTKGDMYDLKAHEVSYDWKTQILKIMVVLDGKIPQNGSFDMMCLNAFLPDGHLYFRQAMDKRVFYFSKKVDLKMFVNYFKFDVYVIGNADRPQLNIGDVDMRNNLYILRIERPK